MLADAAESPLRAGSSQPGIARKGVVGADPGARPAAPVVEGAAPPPEAPTPKAAPKAFRINRIKFEGNQIVPTAELEAIAKSLEHRQVTLPELKALTAKIRALYQGKGYILARAAIPPQKLKSGGDVRVVVSEGKYGAIQIEGNKHYSSKFIRRFFSPAMHLGIVEETSLQRTLLILNEQPDLTVRSLFVPGTAPGTSDVLLKVHDRTAFHYGLDYNNYGSPLVGRNRGGLALWLGNLIQESDEFTARYTEPFPSQSKPLIQGGYATPIDNRGSRLNYSYSNAATVVSGDLAVLDIRGNAEIHSLSYATPLMRTLAKSMNLNAGFVFKTVQNFVLGTTKVSQDNLRELTASVDSNVVKGQTRTLFSVLGTQGLGSLFGGDLDNAAGHSRVGAGNEFGKLNLELFNVRDLGKKQYFLFRFSGQKASKELTVSEQFALGGPDSVRGYLQSDFLGDDGFSSSLEYRKGIFTSKDRKVNMQAVGFFDFGQATLILPNVGERSSRTFAGVGGGVRASFGRTTSLRLDLGYPLREVNSIGTDAVLYAQLVSKW